LPWFRDCCLAGFDSGVEESPEFDPIALFNYLRPQGRKAEEQMEKATGGVNTHRGYIFCLGILCAAYGRLCRNTDKPDLNGIIEFVKAMTIGLEEDFCRFRDNDVSMGCEASVGCNASHGEAVYASSGIKGVRGEVSLGFPSVTKCALPLLNRMLKEGHSINDAGVAVLLNLMTIVEDTNIIHRGGIEAFRTIQEDLNIFLAGDPDMEAIRNKAADMDRDFISKNLSPGGCADLLGITLFLHRILANK
jgi:holo-ACP synthase/triphosphoribosyl-dephospho-CoA synthase